MAQNQNQGGQRGSGINNPNQQGDEADQRRKFSGDGGLPKQQNQDPSRRGAPLKDQHDDPKNNQK